MISFYALPSSILGNDKHSLLRAAYCYYLFANKTSLTDLLNDALILAKRLDFDVFNALDVLENDTFLEARSLQPALQPATSPFACNLPCSLRHPACNPAHPACSNPVHPACRFQPLTLVLAPAPNPSPPRSSSSASATAICSTTCTTGVARRSRRATWVWSSSDRARCRRARAALMSAVVAGGRLRQRGGGPSWDSSWIQEALRGDHACQGSGSDSVVPFEARAGFAFRAQMPVAGQGGAGG